MEEQTAQVGMGYTNFWWESDIELVSNSDSNLNSDMVASDADLDKPKEDNRSISGAKADLDTCLASTASSYLPENLRPHNSETSPRTKKHSRPYRHTLAEDTVMQVLGKLTQILHPP